MCLCTDLLEFCSALHPGCTAYQGVWLPGVHGLCSFPVARPCRLDSAEPSHWGRGPQGRGSFVVPSCRDQPEVSHETWPVSRDSVLPDWPFSKITTPHHPRFSTFGDSGLPLLPESQKQQALGMALKRRLGLPGGSVGLPWARRALSAVSSEARRPTSQTLPAGPGVGWGCGPSSCVSRRTEP